MNIDIFISYFYVNKYNSIYIKNEEKISVFSPKETKHVVLCIKLYGDWWFLSPVKMVFLSETIIITVDLYVVVV